MIKWSKLFFAKRGSFHGKWLMFIHISSSRIAGSDSIQAAAAISFRWGEGPALTQRRVSPGALHFRSGSGFHCHGLMFIHEKKFRTNMIRPCEWYSWLTPVHFFPSKDTMDGCMWSFLEWRVRNSISHRQEMAGESSYKAESLALSMNVGLFENRRLQNPLVKHHFPRIFRTQIQACWFPIISCGWFDTSLNSNWTH